MSMVLDRSTPRPLHDLPVSLHSIDLAVRALRAKLNALNYDPAIAREICIHAHCEHNIAGLVGAGLIDQADEAAIEDAFADGWPEVDPRSVLWKNPDRWTASVPDVREAIEYALLVGEFDPLDCPLPDDFDQAEQPDEDWLSWAQWSSSVDPTDRYETAELAEARISTR